MDVLRIYELIVVRISQASTLQVTRSMLIKQLRTPSKPNTHVQPLAEAKAAQLNNNKHVVSHI
jgi:hypothetical protein